MFHLRVEQLGPSRMSELVPAEDNDNDFMEVFREPLDRDCVEFSVGNPRVEHIAGIVHLYKQNVPGPYGSQQQWKGPAPASAEPQVSQTLCCLAIPADMSVANFCTFIGAYLREVRSIQVLRREGSQPSVCMVLLTFASQEQADSFYADFNAVPFSSLEPDILCRLVYVRSVELLSSEGRPPTAPLPAAAKALTSASAAAGAGAAGSSSSRQDEAVAGLGASKSGQQASSSGSRSSSSQLAAVAAAAGGSSQQQQQQHGEASTSSSAQQGSKDAPPPAAAAAAAAAADQTPSAGGDATKTLLAKPAKQDQQQQQPGPSSSSSGHEGPSYAAAVAGATAASSSSSSSSASPPKPAPEAQQQQQQWLEPPPGTTELPTCPVCLERLDEHISGIVTTVCNHRFHGECLKHWRDTSCPVCRYCMLSSSSSTSRCSTCGSNTNLWICLICGHVGCGRYKQGHANDHWEASAHCYALELETQRVWDYAGDGYVHRLIQSKTDGKLVEVPSPAPTCPHGSPGHHHHHHRGGRGRPAPGGLGRSRSGSSAAAAGGACSSGGGGADPDADDDAADGCPVCADEAAQVKEALVSSKLEFVTLEYNHLLANQLDSQRQYFEGLLAQQDAKASAVLAAARAAAEQAQGASAAAAAAAKESERKRQQLEHKLSELSASVAKVTEEREFLRSLNDTLLANQKEFGAKLAAAQAEIADKDRQLVDLQEQVRDLMVYIEAQRTIQSEGGSELQDATLLPMPAQGKGGSSRSSRRNSKK